MIVLTREGLLNQFSCSHLKCKDQDSHQENVPQNKKFAWSHFFEIEKGL